MYEKKYSSLGITENYLKILLLFTGLEKSWYIREVQKKLDLSPRTAQLILEDLEKKTILFSESKGKIKEYSLNKKSKFCREYIIFAETYKKIIFLHAHPYLREVLENVEKGCHGIIVLFGSYAKGTEKKDSDVDIFIAGKCNFSVIKECIEKYGLSLSPKVYSLASFQKKNSNDFLLKEILRNHIILKGAEEYVSEVLSW